MISRCMRSLLVLSVGLVTMVSACGGSDSSTDGDASDAAKHDVVEVDDDAWPADLPVEVVPDVPKEIEFVYPDIPKDTTKPETTEETDVIPTEGIQEYGAPTIGETCATAEPIEAGVYPDQHTFNYANDYYGAENANGCTGSDEGPDRVYSFSVPVGLRLKASVTPAMEPLYDPSVYIIEGPAAAACGTDPRVCLGSSDDGYPTQTNTASYINGGTAPQPVFIIVDTSNTLSASGIFTLELVLDTPPEGDTCGNAVNVTFPTSRADPVSVTLEDQEMDGMKNDYKDSEGDNQCTSADAGLDRVYKVTLPPNRWMTASVTSTLSGFDPSIYLILGPNPGSCDASPRVCAASNDSGGSLGTDTVHWSNRTAADQVVFVVIDANNETVMDGTFDLSVETGTPPSGDTCANATPLTAGTYTNQTLEHFSSDYNGEVSIGGCSSADAGIDRVYSVSVPKDQRVTVMVSPTDSSYEPTLYLIAGPDPANCDVSPDRVCLASDYDWWGSPISVQWANSTGSTVPVFVVVDNGSETDMDGSFTLDLTVGLPPAGDTCDTAEEIALPQATALAGTTLGFSNDINGGSSSNNCTYADSGPERVYYVTLGAGKGMVVTVIPSSGFDPSLYLINGASAANCSADPLVCLASNDSGSSGGTDSITYINPTSAAQKLFIVVDTGSSGSLGGSYLLTVSLLN